MKPATATKTQRRHQRRSKQRQMSRETKNVETKQVQPAVTQVATAVKKKKKSFPEIQNGQHGEWTDHPGLAYYVMDLDERFQEDFFTGRPKVRAVFACVRNFHLLRGDQATMVRAASSLL